MTKSICLFLLLFLSNCDKSNTNSNSYPASKTYYVDSDAGNDSN